MKQFFEFIKATPFGALIGLIVLLAITWVLFGRAPWDKITARAGGGDFINYGTSFGERQPQSGSYQVGQTVSAGWNALKPASLMESEAGPGSVEITINRLTNIFGTDVSKGQPAFTDEDVANYAAAGFPNGGYEHGFARVGAEVSGDQNSSNWRLTFAWTATTPGYYQIDITPRNNQARSLGWVAVRVEGAPVVSYTTPYTTPYTSPYTYPTPSYSYPTPSYTYPTPFYSYPYPTPYTTPIGGYSTPYSYPYPSPYSYPTPSYTYPTPGTSYAYPTPAYTTPYATPYSTPYTYPTPQTIVIQAPPQQAILAQAAPSVISAPAPKELPKTGSEVLFTPPVLLGLWWLGRKIRKNFKVT